MNIETQNPHKIQDIALQSLTEYRADLEEEDRHERKKTKTKSKKVRRAFIASVRCTGAPVRNVFSAFWPRANRSDEAGVMGRALQLILYFQILSSLALSDC